MIVKSKVVEAYYKPRVDDALEVFFEPRIESSFRRLDRLKRVGTLEDIGGIGANNRFGLIAQSCGANWGLVGARGSESPIALSSHSFDPTLQMYQVELNMFCCVDVCLRLCRGYHFCLHGI